MEIIFYAVNHDGTEICCNCPLYKHMYEWSVLTEQEMEYYCFESSGNPDDCIVKLPKGTIKKLFGKELTFNDYPIKIEF